MILAKAECFAVDGNYRARSKCLRRNNHVGAKLLVWKDPSAYNDEA